MPEKELGNRTLQELFSKLAAKTQEPVSSAVVIGGVFMSPMTIERQELIDQKLRQISQGKY